MATIKKCDVCGQSYQPNKRPHNIIITESIYTFSENGYVDLCNKCQEKLINFLRGKDFIENNK